MAALTILIYHHLRLIVLYPLCAFVNVPCLKSTCVWRVALSCHFRTGAVVTKETPPSVGNHAVSPRTHTQLFSYLIDSFFIG